ncbi:MAG TPA: TetR/AcrR family transcriptional regulator [Lacisediminihabitans sp.]|uniref:TetR/AcrR family transcriptional regulator n=1 Tax=Lacisediminihabitans sp. TaxID=2787631 RepID=UPI002ED79896
MLIVETEPIAQRDPQAGPRRPTLIHHANSAPAKRRILETANRLFYDEGIRSVGIDRLISESDVTKATFYKHYGSKDRLILEYVSGRDAMTRRFITEIIEHADGPESAIRDLAEYIADDVETPGFRGCPFINAATEFADPRHPVRELVIEHREWYTETLVELFKAMGHSLPGEAGDDFLLLRDGAMTGGYAGDPIAATTAMQRAVERLIGEARG